MDEMKDSSFSEDDIESPSSVAHTVPHSLLATATAPTLATAGSVPSGEVRITSRRRATSIDALQPPAPFYNKRTGWLLPLLVAVVTLVATAMFVSLGVLADRRERQRQLNHHATDIVRVLQQSWSQYEVKALWLQSAGCDQRLNITYSEYYHVYQRLADEAFQNANCVWRITQEERDQREQETRAFLEKHADQVPTDYVYRGITGLEPDPNGTELVIKERSEQPVYYTVRWIAPITPNIDVLEFDIYSSPIRRATVDQALETQGSALSGRLELVQKVGGVSGYSVLLMHAGVPVVSSTDGQSAPESPDLATLAVRIPALFRFVANVIQGDFDAQVYLFDASSIDNEFLGGRQFGEHLDLKEQERVLPEQSMEAILDSHPGAFRRDIEVSSRTWTVVVVDSRSRHIGSRLSFVIIGGIVIFCLGTFVTVFVHSVLEKIARLHATQMRSQAMAEESAKQSVKAEAAAEKERELNEFVAHEIRNPLSVALSALHFVTSEVDRVDKGTSYKMEVVEEDLHLVQNCLVYINSLLRSMVDINRAENKHMVINKQPVDIRKSILDIVSTMLYRRNRAIEVLVHCPPDMLVKADAFRLTQVMMNLGQNACKYVSSGFIRLRADVDSKGSVELSVEDSGPGIPLEKRKHLYGKYQDSLDSMNQGTGIGLNLSKKIMELMGGELRFDEAYSSGIPGKPGTRFVAQLNEPLMTSIAAEFLPGASNNIIDVALMASITNPRPETNRIVLDEVSSPAPIHRDASTVIPRKPAALSATDIPSSLSVLFVDDDTVLRKLVVRGMKRVTPQWNVQDAASGEVSIELTKTQHFDLIFMDQYMANVEKQLLGTETVHALRAQGVKSIICGLSANNVGEDFIKAGADHFLLKPFPLKPDKMKETLNRVLNSREEN